MKNSLREWLRTLLSKSCGIEHIEDIIAVLIQAFVNKLLILKRAKLLFWVLFPTDQRVVSITHSPFATWIRGAFFSPSSKLGLHHIPGTLNADRIPINLGNSILTWISNAAEWVEWNHWQKMLWSSSYLSLCKFAWVNAMALLIPFPKIQKFSSLPTTRFSLSDNLVINAIAYWSGFVFNSSIEQHLTTSIGVV